LRLEACHRFSTWLFATYGEVIGEDLAIAALCRSMGRRAFRRAVSDAALGMFRPLATYKAQRSGGTFTLADRWFASSKVHHGCGCQLIAPTKLAKYLVCQVTGELVDRDVNAALNLLDYTGPVGAEAHIVSSPTNRGGDAGPGAEVTQLQGSGCKTRPLGRAVRSEAVTKTPQGEAARWACSLLLTQRQRWSPIGTATGAGPRPTRWCC